MFYCSIKHTRGRSVLLQNTGDTRHWPYNTLYIIKHIKKLNLISCIILSWNNPEILYESTWGIYKTLVIDLYFLQFSCVFNSLFRFFVFLRKCKRPWLLDWWMKRSVQMWLANLDRISLEELFIENLKHYII